MQKKKKKIETSCLKKTLFPDHFGTFLLCKPQNKNFCQNNFKYFDNFFSLYAVVTSCKKSEKSTPSVCYKTYKTHFAPKFQCKIFPEKFFESIFNLYAAALSSKNQKSSMHLFFIKLEKLHFEPISGSFWVKNFKNKIFHVKKH